MRRVARTVLSALILASNMLVQPAGSQGSEVAPGYTENQVKAAFVGHLFNFITFPDGHAAEYICTTEETAFTQNIAAVLAAAPTLKVEIHIMSAADIYASERCNVVLAQTLTASLIEQNAQRDVPVLTISDQPGFARQGGMIELERRPSRVGLIINRARAETAGFTLSSKLLRLATIVSTAGGESDES
jgi:hypothetical protein